MFLLEFYDIDNECFLITKTATLCIFTKKRLSKIENELFEHYKANVVYQFEKKLVHNKNFFIKLQ